jgi:hypothetical protein
VLNLSTGKKLCVLGLTNNRKILWHIEPLLGKDRETSNETTAIGSGVFYVVRSDAL